MEIDYDEFIVTVSIEHVPPCGCSAHACDSDWDYYGYTDWHIEEIIAVDDDGNRSDATWADVEAMGADYVKSFKRYVDRKVNEHVNNED